MSRENQPKAIGGSPIKYTGPPSATGRANLRQPPLEDTTYILIILIVLIPIIFTTILCTITYCVYRYNKKRSQRTTTNSPLVSNDRSSAPIATIIYNPQHSPFVFEELPPSYDSLGETKKDPHIITTLTIPSNATLTNTNERVTTMTPSPPSYINLEESNK